MNAQRLAIVGAGPFCTYALERLAALLAPESPVPLEIAIFDRDRRFGAGATHSDMQARTSYMNRVASQIAFAADESNDAARRLLPREARPTFAEWCQSRYASTGDERYRVGPSEVPRRYLHGEALREAFERYVAMLRSIRGVSVELCVAEVIDVAREEGAFRVRLAGTSLRSLRADRILFVTGHSENDPIPESLAANLQQHADASPPALFVRNAYPLEERVTERAVPAGCSVAVLGLGLTAVDVLLHLTEGRGGRFVRVTGGRPWELTYMASGHEPASIVAVGPSGMFTACRPVNEKAADPSAASHAALEHRGVFLTVDAIRELRRNRGTPNALPDGIVRQLDFERDVLPLIVLELAHIYYSTLLGERFGADIRRAAAEPYSVFLRGGEPPGSATELLLAPVQSHFDDTVARFGRTELLAHRFAWERFFEPLRADNAASGEAWRTALIAYMRRDHAAAAEGNLRNPVKAATDGVWRDLRAVIAEAVDRGGLTARSQRRFMELWLRYYARMSNGTGLEAMSRVLALVEHGVVDVSTGPVPQVEPVLGAARFRVTGTITRTQRDVDVVVEGKAHPFDPVHDAGPLYPAMMRRGLVRLWRNPGASAEPDFVPGGLDLSPSFHPVQADGTVEERLTFLGAPAETVWFFQLSAARPGSNSAVLNNVARWAADFVDALAFETTTARSRAF